MLCAAAATAAVEPGRRSSVDTGAVGHVAGCRGHTGHSVHRRGADHLLRLIKTLIAMGVASQSYLRAGVSVLLGFLMARRAATAVGFIGLVITIAGVALINWPARAARPSNHNNQSRRPAS